MVLYYWQPATAPLCSLLSWFSVYIFLAFHVRHRLQFLLRGRRFSAKQRRNKRLSLYLLLEMCGFWQIKWMRSKYCWSICLMIMIYFAVFQIVHMHATAWGRRIGTSMAHSPIISWCHNYLITLNIYFVPDSNTHCRLMGKSWGLAVLVKDKYCNPGHSAYFCSPDIELLVFLRALWLSKHSGCRCTNPRLEINSSGVESDHLISSTGYWSFAHRVRVHRAQI